MGACGMDGERVVGLRTHAASGDALHASGLLDSGPPWPCWGFTVVCAAIGTTQDRDPLWFIIRDLLQL